MSYETAREFAQFIKGLGFRAFVAGALGGDGPRGYGFITDREGTRVLSFQFSDGGSLGGNYGPPSQESGTGWRMDATPWDIKTAADVKRFLYATAPDWTRRGHAGRCHTCGREHEGAKARGWQYYTTLEQHLAAYGSSSKYEEI